MGGSKWIVDVLSWGVVECVTECEGRGGGGSKKFGIVRTTFMDGRYALCSMLCALCYVLCALWSMLYALCIIWLC